MLLAAVWLCRCLGSALLPSPLVRPALRDPLVLRLAGEATGPCKARQLAQQLWDGEEFFLQVGHAGPPASRGWRRRARQGLLRVPAPPCPCHTLLALRHQQHRHSCHAVPLLSQAPKVPCVLSVPCFSMRVRWPRAASSLTLALAHMHLLCPASVQVDSHMRFVQGWDTLLLEQLHAAEAQSSCGKAVLSTYPVGYEGEGPAGDVPEGEQHSCAGPGAEYGASAGIMRIMLPRCCCHA